MLKLRCSVIKYFIMKFFLLVFTFLFFNQAYSLDLQDALTAAYKNNAELLAARQEVLAVHEAIVQAKKGYRPSIQARGVKSFGASRSKPNSDSISRHNHSQRDSGSLSISQNIFRGGADAATVSKTEFEIKGQWAKLRDKEQQIMQRVIEAYLDICVKSANVETYNANMLSMQKSYEAARDKKNIGEETLTNESASEAKYAQSQAQLEQAKAELEAARAVFEQLTSLKPPAILDYPKIVPDLAASLEDLEIAALENNPAILQARAEYEAAKSSKKVATGQLLPSVDLSASSSRNIDSPKTKVYGNIINNTSTKAVNNQAEISINVPLYEQGAIRSQRRQSQEFIIQKRIAIENIRRLVQQNCRQIYLNYSAAKTNLKNHDIQLRSQEVAVESIRQEVAVGTKVLTDLLIQETNLLSAKLNRIQNIQAYYKAIYQMVSLQGKLTGEGMSLPVEYFKPENDYNNVKNRF